ncbi:MAG: YdcF family protein [Brevinematales bacterium]|nr:YdcF family protein [Brevinematales bacterium]
MTKHTTPIMLLSGGVALFLLSFVAMLILVIQFSPSQNLPDEGIVVIFGAGIYSSRPSLTLQMRLDRGRELFSSMKKATLYLSGTRSEVAIMKQYLVKHGIPRECILEDPLGKTTAHTIRNLAHRYTATNLILVSQQYHLRRIALLCRKYHLLSTWFVATDHRPIDHHYLLLIREAFALYKAFLWD